MITFLLTVKSKHKKQLFLQAIHTNLVRGRQTERNWNVYYKEWTESIQTMNLPGQWLSLLVKHCNECPCGPRPVFELCLLFFCNTETKQATRSLTTQHLDLMSYRKEKKYIHFNFYKLVTHIHYSYSGNTALLIKKQMHSKSPF